MERPKSRADVAVFIDFENVYVSVREKFDATPNFEMIMDRCEDYGRIVIARAYADWYRYPRVTSALFANGVEPMYVPTYYYDREVGRTGRPIKNSVDIHLCIDVMRSLYTQHHIDKFVLVTGDRDFIPLVNAIRQNGKEVVIIGIGGASSAHLAQSADEFLFYEQIADLKQPQQPQQRQEPKQEQSAKPERREREKPERSEQREKPERAEQREKPERSDGNGKVDSKREREKPERTAPVEAEPEVAAVQRSVYDTLVDAIQLARQRGFVSNLGSLKVLMRELDSGFNESKVKDANGRPFSKFKDFVKEAERQGKVQIFTNGTVTEVFLPGEDPMHVSQFAEDLASQQAERELESELELEALRAPEVAEPVELVPEPVDFAEPVLDEPDEPDEPVLDEPEPQPVVTPAAEEPTDQEETTVRPTFGEREWQIFRGSMSQFTDPVRFADIFSALRGLRNQEIIDLTNNELKELVKQAINRGMLQRTGRGAKAYYRLSSQYRVTRDEFYSEPPRATAETQEPTAAEDPLVESAAGLVEDTGVAAAVKRRRARAYSSLAAAADAAAQSEASAETAASPSAAPTADTGAGLELSDRVNEQLATQRVDEPSAKPRRNRRKKPATPAAEADQPVEAVADAAPASVEADQAESTAEADESKKTNGTKKRRSRRKKTTDESPAAESETGGE